MGIYYSLDEEENIIQFCSYDLSSSIAGNLRPNVRIKEGTLGLYIQAGNSNIYRLKENSLISFNRKEFTNIDEVFKEHGKCFILFEDYDLSIDYEFKLEIKLIAVAKDYIDIYKLKNTKNHIIELIGIS